MAKKRSSGGFGSSDGLGGIDGVVFGASDFLFESLWQKGEKLLKPMTDKLVKAQFKAVKATEKALNNKIEHDYKGSLEDLMIMQMGLNDEQIQQLERGKLPNTNSNNTMSRDSARQKQQKPQNNKNQYPLGHKLNPYQSSIPPKEKQDKTGQIPALPNPEHQDPFEDQFTTIAPVSAIKEKQDKTGQIPELAQDVRQQEQIDIKKEMKDEKEREEVKALTQEYRDKDITLAEEQLKYLKLIAEKDFGGSGEGGRDLIDTLLDGAMGGAGGKKKGGGIKNFLKGAGRVAGPLALITAAYTAGSSAFDGYKNEDAIRENEGKFGDEEVTTGDKIKNAGKSAVSGLVGGLGDLVGSAVGLFSDDAGKAVKGAVGTDAIKGYLDSADRGMQALKNGVLGDGFVSDRELRAREAGYNSFEEYKEAMMNGEEAKKKEEESKNSRVTITKTDEEVAAEMNAERLRVGARSDNLRIPKPEDEEEKLAKVNAKPAYKQIADEYLKSRGLETNNEVQSAKVAAITDGNDGFNNIPKASFDSPLRLSGMDMINDTSMQATAMQSKLAEKQYDNADDSSSSSLGNMNVNNVTNVIPNPPRYRISDQSTIALALQGG